MWEIAVLVVVISAVVIVLLRVIYKLIKKLILSIRNIDKRVVIKNDLIVLVTIIFGITIFGACTQWFAKTPAITDKDGNVIKNSIAELRKINVNGHNEWVSIRGQNKNNPVLLFLAGGPGGSQMAAVRHELSELEKYFVVVNWDQPGSGKSYFAVNHRKITVNTYIQDGYKITRYLCKRFKHKKIYLVGESWGSALGIFLSKSYPECYHAFIGTGQMVDFLETEKIDYNKAMKIAKESNDKSKINKLKKNGPPPYYGDSVTWKSAEYLNYLSAYMEHNSNINNSGYHTLRDIAASEYGIVDKFTWFLGLLNTFNQVYPQLYHTDLRKEYSKINVPVYFFIGKYDINAPVKLTEQYYKLLKSPHKELIWFEHSGHDPWINESKKFVNELIRISKSKNIR